MYAIIIAIILGDLSNWFQLNCNLIITILPVIIVYRMGRLCGGAHKISSIKAPLFSMVGGRRVLGMGGGVVVGWVVGGGGGVCGVDGESWGGGLGGKRWVWVGGWVGWWCCGEWVGGCQGLSESVSYSSLLNWY